LALLGRRLTEEDFWVFDGRRKTDGRRRFWEELFDDWGNWDILDCDEVGLETLGS